MSTVLHFFLLQILSQTISSFRLTRTQKNVFCIKAMFDPFQVVFTAILDIKNHENDPLTHGDPR